MKVIAAHWADGTEVSSYIWEDDGAANTVLIFTDDERCFRYNIRPDGLVGSYITEVFGQ